MRKQVCTTGAGLKRHMFRAAVMGIALFAGTVHADVLEMVHNAGFTGCDTAIGKKLSNYEKAGNGRVSTDYFDKNGKSISIMVTYGEHGDAVWQRMVFVKEGARCEVYQTTMITSKLSCIAYKEENPVWKYVASQGDYTWTKNKGGVDALLLSLPTGGCSILFNLDNFLPADSTATGPEK